MQILPSNGVNDTFGFFGTSSEKAGDFFSAMNDAMDSVKNGDNYSVDSALDKAPEVESPYTKYTTDGVTYTMSEVLFSKSELAELRLALLKEGAPEETLKQFDILADQPNGATLAQVMASLVGQTSKPKISEADEQQIISFLGQIDPTGDLAAAAFSHMKEGNGSVAFEMIQNAVGRMDQGSSIDIDIQQMMALGKGLGLSNDSLRQIAENFANQSSLTLNGQQFDALMKPATNQFMQEAANMSKLEAALDKTLRPIISKARDRMEQEKLASERESRRVQQSRILIDKTVQANSREMIDETVASRDAGLAGRASRLSGHAGETQKKADGTAKIETKPVTGETASNAQSAANTKSAVNAIQTQPNSQQDASDAKDRGKDKGNAWSELLGKVETNTIPHASLTNAAVYSMIHPDLEAMPMTWQPEAQLDQPMLPSQIVQQVEQGLLTAMGDGSTRLDLQLHPAELGNVGITLIARNGELTAILRSEKTETAEMLQRQAETIRVNLEQQGVRVDKIEVHLENNQDSTQNSFQDLDQHNARQQEDARRQELERLRNLANLRQADANESILAQSMHSAGQTARYAGQALHVVA